MHLLLGHLPYSVVFGEPVPHAADRLDQGARGRRASGAGSDVHIDGAGTAVEVPTPDALQQGLARENDAGLAHEVLEKVELAQGELELLAVHRGAAMAHDREMPESSSKFDLLGHATAAQQGAAPARKLHQGEGLGEVVVGAPVKGDDLVELGASAVSIMMGTWAVSWSARRRRRISRPSVSGSMMSSRDGIRHALGHRGLGTRCRS